MDQRYELLRQPVAIGNVVLKNRMVMAPMGARLFTGNGEVSPSLIEYFLARVRGGAALITVGVGQVDGRLAGSNRPNLDDDGAIPGFRRLVDAIHSEGAPIFMQLHHGGPNADIPISPSGVACLAQYKGFTESRAMSLEAVEEMRDRFVDAAVRCKRAGFDGVQMAGQANYLLGQFISPRTNLRTDRYGGSLEKRMCFALEIIRGIRRECGPDFVVGYAMAADELMPDGTTVEQSLTLAVALEREGLDFIDIRVGTHESFAMSERATGHNRHQSRDGIWEYSERFKKALKIPVVCSAQGCYDPVRWEAALRDGQADIIGLAKSVLADPEVPVKVLEGRHEEIRPCVYCLFCLDPSASAMRPFCSVNPETGRETDYVLVRSAEPKKVLVVGGGPGGLEAARVAALRGHRVTVIEKDTEAGGSLKVVGLCTGSDVYLKYRDWLVRQCSRAGVKFELGKAATLQVVRDARPDAVIVATGAGAPVTPPIPGIDKAHVIKPIDALSGQAPIGKNVVVLGGSAMAVDTAQTLAAQGRADSITIVEPLRVSTIAGDLSQLERTFMTMTLLPRYEVEAFTGVRVEEITNREVVVVDGDGSRQKIKADTVVNALGSSPNPALLEALRAEDLELYAIGDCVKAGRVADAVHEGARVARLI